MHVKQSYPFRKFCAHGLIYALFLITSLLGFTLLQKPVLAEPPTNNTLTVSMTDEESLITERIVYNGFKRLGVNVVIQRLGIKTAMEAVNNGESQILATQTAQILGLYENLVQVPVPISTVDFYVYTKDASTKNFQSWSDLSGMTVAYNKENLYLQNHLPKDCKAIVKKESSAQLIETLIAGGVDAVVITIPEKSGYLVKKGIKQAGRVDSVPVYTYINKNYADLVPRLTTAYEEMVADGTMEKLKKQQSISTSPTHEKIILHVSSYNSEMGWESDLIRGLRDSFKLQKNSVYFNFPLNLRELHNIDSQKNALKGAICSTFLDRSPDVIIASDNDALDFVITNYYKLFKGLPVVFCGVDNYTSETLHDFEQSITGIVEDVSAVDTVKKMLEIYPDTRSIYVVNDSSPSTRNLKNVIRKKLQPFEQRVQITYSDDMPFDALQAKIRSFDDDTLVLVGSYFVDSDNQFFAESEVAKAISAASKRPVFCLMPIDMGFGFFGGKMTNGYNHGFTAGEMARKILNGTDISYLPVVSTAEHLNRWTFDYAVAKQFGVPTRYFPMHTLALNKTASLFETNPVQATALVSFAVLAVIIGLVFFFVSFVLRKQNRALLDMQKHLHTSEELLQKDMLVKEIYDQLEHIIASTPFAFAIMIEGKIVRCNDYTREVFGVDVGTMPRSFFVDPAVRDAIQQRLKNHERIRNEIVWVRIKNNVERRFNVSYIETIYSNQTAHVAWAVDIEDIEQQKDGLKRAERALRRVIDTLPIPMMIVGLSTKELLYCNRSYAVLFGYDTPTAARGLKQEELLDYYEAHLVKKIGSDSFDNILAFEYVCKTPSGKDIELMLYANMIEYNNMESVVLICQDISDQKKQAQLLQSAADKEREANQLKSVFLANMSHEIRTPMNAVIGLSQVALMKHQDADNMDLYRKINLSAKNLLSIINDILDFSKIEAEKLDLVDDEFCLEEIISNAFMVAIERIEDKRVEVLLDLDPNVPCYLYGDKTRLWQILKNLLDNAAKFTDAGRIVLHVSVDEQQTDLEKVTVVFDVTDTGVGMDPSQLDRLFTPFEQLHNAEFKNKKMGTGLGMSITKQLVAMLGGDIHVTSTPHVGTNFMIRIPYKWADITITTQKMITTILTDAKQILSPVLLADDDVCALKIMSHLLETNGIETVCVTSGDEVMEAIRVRNESGDPFHMIILDYLLGKDNGLEIGRKIKLICNDVRLLMVTAYSKQFLSLSDIQDAGFLDIIEKPFIVSTFFQKICRTVAALQEQAEYPSFPHARVLLCEDNQINQQVACSMLEAFDVVPEIAQNGTEAIAWLEKEKFDLVFMDIIMPVMDGHEATTHIRQSQADYKDVPIIAMTANVMNDEVTRCFEEGMNGHIEKPIDFDALQRHLVAYLQNTNVK